MGGQGAENAGVEWRDIELKVSGKSSYSKPCCHLFLGFLLMVLIDYHFDILLDALLL